MTATCLQFLSFVVSALGWVGILIATSTNSWVQTCSHGAASCRRFDELGSYGLWTECFTSFGIYHCKNLADILEIPAYVQISRALMITASILGLPAIFLVLTALPCMHLGSETESVKHKRSLLGAILLLCVALCTAVATIWFPVGVHHEKHLYNFGYSLFAGWIGTALCFFGGAVISCCTGSAADRTENRYYYSSQGSSSTTSPTHAKSVHI
ncbi:claudin-11a [Callorhinchus milii]|uniref:Claudin n=1 Tax=Callorhinchus milii TaxID=7868 RepID=A0A4W3I561_CALMI|nr:claudin-11a [Callorhinchus milii]|eukprot:gi/632981935/ref/XP_007907860.1/ PREDICTED: claudin-11 [Callorhinchus milii]